MTTTPTPVERAVAVLHQHVQTTIATISAGLPSDRAMRDVTGVTASCEQAVLGEVTHGGPLTRQGLDVAVHRAFAAALDPAEIARVLADWFGPLDGAYTCDCDAERCPVLPCPTAITVHEAAAAALVAHLTQTGATR